MPTFIRSARPARLRRRRLFVGSKAAAASTGTLSVTLGAITLSGAGTFVAATPAAGTTSATLGAITLSSTATATVPTYTGSLATTLGAITLAGAGTFVAATPAAGTTTATLGPVTLAGVGTFVAAGASTGAVSTTLGPVTLAGVGTFTAAASATGTTTATLAPVTLAGVGTFTASGGASGTLAATLGAITATGAATFVAATPSTGQLGGSGAMPTYGAQASDVIGPSASISVAYPTGTAAGKTLVYLLAYTNTATISTPPAGFTAGSTQANGTRTLALYTRVCDGSESGSVSVTLSASVRRVGAMLLVDATAATPIDLAGFATGTGTTGTAPAITTTGDNRLGVRVLAVAGNSGAVTIPSTSRLYVSDGTGSGGITLAASTESFTTAGTTSTAAFTWGVSVEWIACTLALSPPASGYALGAITLSSTATFAAASNPTGTLNSTVSVVLAGVGAFVAATPATGSLAATLGAYSLASTATFTAAGNATADLTASVSILLSGIGRYANARPYPTFFTVIEADVQGYRATESRGDWNVIETDPRP
jgi:hypothetical protein